MGRTGFDQQDEMENNVAPVHFTGRTTATAYTENRCFQSQDSEYRNVRRQRLCNERLYNAGRRVTAGDDPVTARLAMLCGIADTRLDLFAGLAFAAVLEGAACLFWWLALTPSAPESSVTHGVEHTVTAETVPVVMPARSPTPTIVRSTIPPVVQPTVTPPESDIARLRRDIESGAVKPTVAGIRQHLGCSQAKASALRRQLTDLTA